MSFLPVNSLLRLNYGQPPLPTISKGAAALHRRHFRCQSINSGKISKDEHQLKYEEKMEEVRNFLYEIQEDDLQVLHVINAIQHLGIDHHFQDQIGSILQRQYNKFGILFHDTKELFEISFRFRLLRQDGYYIPSEDVFTKFINDKGKFKEELSKDIKGLMALHEASHLSIQGENILDEAEKFSRKSLITNMACLDDHKAIIVQNTLQYPYHKSFSRLKAKAFIENMRFENEWEASLVNLATMDYGITQSLQQEEIFQVLQWWKGLGLMNELAKNQQLKWYIWTLTLPDPSKSKERVEITKLISLVYLIDNIIDVYGTFDQNIQFLDAICRWEISVAEGLPDYMKRCLVVLFDTTNDINSFIFNKYGWNSIDHLKKAWKNLCEAFITEAKWFATGNCPTADEYLKIGITTTGVPMALIASFLVLGHGASTRTIDIIEDIITSVGAILRLLDDLEATQGEKQEENDASYVEYYIKEHQGLSLSDGKQHVMKMVSGQWKLINKQCLSPTPIPASFRKACLNIARMVPMMYNYSDTHNLPTF